MNMKNLQNETPKNRYLLLARMQSDCKYYLGFGKRNPAHLWSTDEREQIQNMKLLYNSFPADEKPDWISMEEIEYYELRMISYTWDELYTRAEGSGYGDPELRAKDEARFVLTGIIEEQTGVCVDDLEIPEEGIESFLLNTPVKYLFTADGNLVSPSY